MVSRGTILTGVSSGLGEALFDELNAAGDRILAIGRRFTGPQLAAADREPHRIRLHTSDLADLSTLPDSRELASFAGEVETVAMIHNAAVIGPFDAIGALPAGEIDAAVTVNLVAPMVLTNALLAGGLRGDRGGEPGGEGSRRVSVLFISSSAAHRVSGGRSVYSATKRGGEAFFEALAAQYAGDDRVYVAVVDPGIMDTPMQATIRRVARSDAYFPDRDRFLTRHQRGELPRPAEVARRIIRTHLGR